MTTTAIEETYTPYGNMSRLFTSTAPELILGGPAGTGKSRCILEYFNYLATEYPGARLLMLRKTRRSLTESGMVTFEQKVLHPAQGVRFVSSQQRYIYPNGSILAVGGMDKASKVLSSEWDCIFAQESNELDESDWEMCSMRLRNGRIPLQQIVGDVNPGPPNHWIKQREQAKRLLLLETYHEDNPVLFKRNGQITPEGAAYLARLDQLTGVRYLRYRKGLWCSSDGMVYEAEWNPKIHLINRFEMKRTWRRWLSIDFGFSNPFVCQWWAIDDDGRLYRYREIYKTKTLVEDHAKDIAIASGWFHLLPPNHPKYKPRPADWADPLPQAIICDHDIEDRKTLERHLGLNTTAAKKTVSNGIQAVASRLRPAGDGKPRLMFLRDSLVERDRDLAEAKKPTCFEDEVESYIWKQGSNGPKEEPVKENDHACLVAGTLVTTDHGDVPIETIKAGDYVWTRAGYRRVKAAGMTSQNAQVFTVHFSDGRTLTGTANHPIYLHGQGYIPLHALRYGDKIEDINSSFGRSPLCQSAQPTGLNRLSTKGSRLDAIQTLLTGQTKVTTAQIPSTLWLVSKLSTSKYGKMLMDLCQKVVTFTTKTVIHPIMRWITWNALQQKSMHNIMLRIYQKSNLRNVVNGLIPFVHWLLHGTNQKRAEHGIALLEVWHTRMQSIKHILVSIARKNFNQDTLIQKRYAFAPLTAKPTLGEIQGLITRHVHVDLVEKHSPAIVMQKTNFVLENVTHNASNVGKSDIACSVEKHSSQSIRAQKSIVQPHVLTITSITDKQPVYNLTVETQAIGEEGEYFANGILVHNCDATRYMVAHLDLQGNNVDYIKGFWR